MKQKRILATYILCAVSGSSFASIQQMTMDLAEAPPFMHQGPGMPPGPPPPGGHPPPQGFPPGPPGPRLDEDTGTGAYLLRDGETLTGGTYRSINADENALRAEGNITASLNNVTVLKHAGYASSNDASSFYGLNSAVLALHGANLSINGGSVTATADGSTGVFAYDGATIHMKNTDINVTGGNAGGIEVAGGGNIYATNLTVGSTQKAAIRSDRGGGKIVVNGGTYTTTGLMGAPAIYSTAQIDVRNATLTSNDSEAVVIEGYNSVSITNSHVTGSMDGTYDRHSDQPIRNVMLYQSMSGDANNGTSTFTMNGGSLASKNGDMFYVTNTDSVINLQNVALTMAKGARLLLVAGNNAEHGWGQVGNNGGICRFNLSQQNVTGDIEVDEISQLDMSISNGSSFTGSINSDATKANMLTVSIDENSTWALTNDSYIRTLNGSMKNIVLNGHKLVVSGKRMTP
ncbi:hypothetical protein OAP63_05710 [Vibrio sp.]|nr:hypothetical protein [Vibrio sp.]